MQQIDCLQVQQLSLRVKGKLLLEQISFEIPEKKKVALVGLNGAGKSSLIKILVGSTQPSQGTVDYQSLSPRDLAFKKQLGYQAAAMQALPNITCREYFNLCCNLKSSLKSSAESSIAQIAKLWFLDEILDKPMSRLSQGNLQKTVIAQAFLGEPGYIFLDEPTQALDPIEQRRFIDNMSNLNGHQLCLFSSHHVNEAVQAADLVLMLHRGKKIALLDLNAKNEFWFVTQATSESVGGLLTDKKAIAIYRNATHGLYRIKDVSESQWQEMGQKLNAQDASAQLLGRADQALMPLFTLLANGVL